jgi:DNA primase
MNLDSEIKELFLANGIYVHAETGQELTIYCPFHQNRNTPSFYINRKTGLWQCFNPSCGERGNFKKLFRQITGKAYGKELSVDPVALSMAIERGLRPSFKEEELSLDSVAIDYDSGSAVTVLRPLVERGLSLATLQHFEIGYSEVKNRIVIPVRNQHFKVVGLIGRAIESSQEPRYLYNKGFKRADVLFNIQNAKPFSEVIVVEGSVDAMKVHESGYPNVVATLGSQVSEKQVKMLKSYFDKIIVFSDRDEAGFAMRDAILRSCCGKDISVAEIPADHKDPAELDTKQIQQSLTNKKQTI